LLVLSRFSTLLEKSLWVTIATPEHHRWSWTVFKPLAVDRSMIVALWRHRREEQLGTEQKIKDVLDLHVSGHSLCLNIHVTQSSVRQLSSALPRKSMGTVAAAAMCTDRIQGT
jgi:hypothetical protein